MSNGFANILHPWAGFYSLVLQKLSIRLFAQVYSVGITAIYLLLSYQDSFVNMITTCE